MVNNTISIENAEIIFRNFAGNEGQYNRKGDRNFCVLINNEMAPKLLEDGWAVKYLRQTDPNEPPKPFLQVKVSFDNIPPRVVLITSKNKKELNPDNIEMLDWAELDRVDLIIRPYNWEVNGRTGVKAYLKCGYFTIAEDEFAARYEDIPME